MMVLAGGFSTSMQLILACLLVICSVACAYNYNVAVLTMDAEPVISYVGGNSDYQQVTHRFLAVSS